MFEAGDTDGPQIVNELAQAGGTERAVLVDSSADVDQQFLDALRAIRNGQLGCTFQLPSSSVQLDYLTVNLEYRNGTTSQTLPFVGNRAGCGAAPSGWHYDVDPKQRTPSEIQVCPNVCTQIKAAASASVQMQIGCATIIR